MRALLLTLVWSAFVFAIVFVVIAFGVRWGLSMWWNTRCFHDWEPAGADGVQCRHCRKRLQAYKVRSQLARQASAQAAEQPSREA